MFFQIYLGVVSAAIFFVFYQLFQIKRNKKVFSIRQQWITDKDFTRLNRHTYDDMYEPTLRNMYGLKMPRDRHFR